MEMPLSSVILGLDPRIHSSAAVDPRVKPEDDVECGSDLSASTPDFY